MGLTMLHTVAAVTGKPQVVTGMPQVVTGTPQVVTGTSQVVMGMGGSLSMENTESSSMENTESTMGLEERSGNNLIFVRFGYDISDYRFLLQIRS